MVDKVDFLITVAWEHLKNTNFIYWFSSAVQVLCIENVQVIQVPSAFRITGHLY